MPAGPITIFDKSAREDLSLDEAALFGHFYQIVITPISCIEALADGGPECGEIDSVSQQAL